MAEIVEEVIPVIPDKIDVPPEPSKELTGRGIILAIILSTIMAASNAYLALYIGVSITVSIPAAIIGITILKSFGTTIFEINAIQTGASSGSLVSTGLVFTIPGLLILDYWTNVHYIETCVISIVGAALGIMFSIPIRRALIVESPLVFPEGAATAEVIKTTVGEGAGKAERLRGVSLLLFGAILGSLLKLACSTFFLWADIVETGFWIDRVSIYFGISVTPALASVGAIVGALPSCFIFLGCIINWYIAIPCVLLFKEKFAIPNTVADSALTTAKYIFSNQTRYIGVGAMLFAGIATIFLLVRPILSGVTSGIAAFRKIRSSGMGSIPATDRDIPIPIIFVCIIFAFFPLFFLFWYFTDVWYIALVSSLFMLVSGFVFSCVGAYMAGVVGSSQNPISGVTLATVIVAALLLLLFLGKDNPLGPASAILIGSVIAVAASISGDNMQDLKTGQILGATPYKLQLMQLIGAIVPCFVLPLVIDLIIKAYGLGLPTEEYPSPLPAPQANLIADISYSIFFGGAPIDMIGYGMGIAAFFVFLDLILMFRKSKFRIAVLSIALGLYIPYNINAALLSGGLTSLVLSFTLKKAYPDDPGRVEMYTRNSVLLAAGLITGEALTGIIFAIPVVVSGDLYLLAFLGVKEYFWPGILTLALILLIIYLAGAFPFIRSKLQKPTDD